jgi:tetratricopeptide (TPR) repeat protein
MKHNDPHQDWELEDLVQKAIALRSKGKSIEAVDLCLKGLQKYPLSIDLKCQLGQACFEKGDEDGARRELEEVVKTMERNRVAFQVLDKICKQERRKGVHRGHPRERQLLKPSLIPIEKNTRTIADLYYEQGHIKEALEIYKALLRESSDDPNLKKTVQDLTAKLEERGSTRGHRRSIEKAGANKKEILSILHSWQMAIQRRQKEKGFVGSGK